MTHDQLDYIGVGFGPSNLAIAVAASERSPAPRGLFFESKPSFQWHPGMMLNGARMQISWLKDLVTLRNPMSPYSFLQYLKSKGRLEHFVNLCEFFPSRREYQDYLSWVAEAFRFQVHYGARVRKITPMLNGSRPRIDGFYIEAESVSGNTLVYQARNIICAPGGRPRLMDRSVTPCSSIMHTAGFLDRFPARFPDRQQRYRFGIVGDGQSAADVAKYILDNYPNARLHVIIDSYALRPADCSPFVNELFFSGQVDWFHGLSRESRSLVARQLKNTNYGVVDSALLKSLYESSYADEVEGTQRLFVVRCSRLVSGSHDNDVVEIVTRSTLDGNTTTLHCDGLVLATGYSHELDHAMIEDLLPYLALDEHGRMMVSRQYRVQTSIEARGGIYLQGLNEASHGLGDSLLSLLPFRSQEILDDMSEMSSLQDNRRTAVSQISAPGAGEKTGGDYPPQRHLEADNEKLYAVLERCPFATVISGEGDKPLVTHVPLTLDRSRGRLGILFGHMDRQNPHIKLLDNRPILAIFHGPNAYISPHEYRTDQLPTWNSISVHVRGTVRLLRSRNDLVRGLLGICEYADRKPGAYRLSPDDSRIPTLIDFIVGFEIEIEELIGRFKLSQDRNSEDQLRAMEALIRRSEEGERSLVTAIVKGGVNRVEHVVLDAQELPR
jgi:L-ornithine N5-oxygenase